MATLAQQQQPVEITSEPRHHHVFENHYVRVFDVTVEPKGSTLVHRHSHDYLFVTLGDSQVASVRPGEKPVELSLKDGEIRYTPGNFAHAAINRSDKPFHNTTIELLLPSTNVKTCTEACEVPVACVSTGKDCPTIERRISSDQWSASLINIPPQARLQDHVPSSPYLLVAVSALNLGGGSADPHVNVTLSPGGLSWVHAPTHTIVNNSSTPAEFVTLEFHGEKQ
jgi:quercetin dioxygenase-like cupin family protein